MRYPTPTWPAQASSCWAFDSSTISITSARSGKDSSTWAGQCFSCTVHLACKITLSRRNPDILQLDNLYLDLPWLRCLGARQASQRGSMVVMYRCTAHGGLKQTRCLHTHPANRFYTHIRPVWLEQIPGLNSFGTLDKCSRWVVFVQMYCSTRRSEADKMFTHTLGLADQNKCRAFSFNQ